MNSYHSLNDKEKLLLYVGLSILSKLEKDKEQKKHIELHIECLTSGIPFSVPLASFHYSASEQDSDFVSETMEMFTRIYFSLNALGKDEKKATFPGFDGNTESNFLACARVLLSDDDAFDMFRDVNGRSAKNSHIPMADTYKKINEEVRKFEGKYPNNIPLNDVVRILRIAHINIE